MTDQRPIGVFDSGVGGLTVLRELVGQLPGEDFLYFGDTARLPYGPRSKEVVVRYALECAQFLIHKGVKLLVVACNTATAMALPELQRSCALPVIGVIDPGSRAAAQKTEKGIIGVIGTSGTISQGAYQEAIRKNLPEAEIIGIPCPLFVQIVEEGWEGTDVAELTARRYLSPFREYDIDTLVLGCTHYPPLRYTISKVLGEAVTLVNPAYETAKETKRVLRRSGLAADRTEDGRISFYASDDPEKFKIIGSKIVTMRIRDVERVQL